jgi:hypothetical protein
MFMCFVNVSSIINLVLFWKQVFSYSGTLFFRCSPILFKLLLLVLPFKYWIGLEKHAMDKRSSLFGFVNNDEEKKFYQHWHQMSVWIGKVGPGRSYVVTWGR